MKTSQLAARESELGILDGCAKQGGGSTCSRLTSCRSPSPKLDFKPPSTPKSNHPSNDYPPPHPPTLIPSNSMESTPTELAEGAAVIKVLAAVLERLVSANGKIAEMDPGVITRFHALKPPSISVLSYLQRIHKYASCSTECFILALIYIDRLIQVRKGERRFSTTKFSAPSLTNPTHPPPYTYTNKHPPSAQQFPPH